MNQFLEWLAMGVFHLCLASLWFGLCCFSNEFIRYEMEGKTNTPKITTMV